MAITSKSYTGWLRRLVAVIVVYALGGVALASAGSDGPGWDVAAIAFLFALAAIALHCFVEHKDYCGTGEFWLRITTIVVLSGALVLLARFWDAGARGFLTVTVAYFATGQILIEVRTARLGAPWRGPIVLAGCGVVVIEGLRSLAGGSHIWGYAAVAAGLAIAPVGIALASEDWFRRSHGLAPSRRREMFLFGVAAIVAGHLLLPHTLPHVVLLVTTMLVLTIGGMASRTDLDVIAVVISVGVVIAWALEPHAVPLTKTVKVQGGEAAVVALGDSFMSGEGAPTYYAGTNTKNVDECRRAPTAYAVRTVELGNVDVKKLVFLACSGARLDDVYRDEPNDVPVEEKADPHQLARFEAETPPDVRLVILSVGGNDAGFGTIGRTCVMPGNCSELGQCWLDKLRDVRRGLSVVYAAVDEAFKSVPVLVVPYPIPLDDDGCSWSTMLPAEHRFLNGFTNELNAVVRDAAAEARFYFLDKMEDAFLEDELRICDRGAGEVGVNFLAAHSVEGVLDDRVNPLHWTHNSLHPNPRGHEAMATVLEDWILDHENVPARRPQVGAPARDVPRLEDLMGVEDLPHCGDVPDTPPACNGTADEWASARMGRTIARLGLPALLIVLGAWILWLSVLWKPAPPPEGG